MRKCLTARFQGGASSVDDSSLVKLIHKITHYATVMNCNSLSAVQDIWYVSPVKGTVNLQRDLKHRLRTAALDDGEEEPKK